VLNIIFLKRRGKGEQRKKRDDKEDAMDQRQG
jgi:hypothetical protein